MTMSTIGATAGGFSMSPEERLLMASASARQSGAFDYGPTARNRVSPNIGEGPAPLLERVAERLHGISAKVVVATGRVEAFGDRVLGERGKRSSSVADCARNEPAISIEQRLSLLLTALEAEVDRLAAAADRLGQIG